MSLRPARALVAVAIATLSNVALAEPSSCQKSYEQAQESRAGARLTQARTDLLGCMAPECPDFVREDCARWLTEVEAAQPSIVLSATRDGQDLVEVEVSANGEPLVRTLDGKAIPIDPGRYELRFQAAGLEPVTVEAVIREGEKSRMITAVFPSTPAPESRPPPPRAARSVPAGPSAAVYSLAGVGLLGLGAFATFGALGNAEKAEQERGCAPDCTDADVSAIRTRYLLADVSLGVGVAALGVAAYLLFTAEDEPERAPSLALDIGLSPRGAQSSLRAAF